MYYEIREDGSVVRDLAFGGQVRENNAAELIFTAPALFRGVDLTSSQTLVNIHVFTPTFDKVSPFIEFVEIDPVEVDGVLIRMARAIYPISSFFTQVKGEYVASIKATDAVGTIGRTKNFRFPILDAADANDTIIAEADPDVLEQILTMLAGKVDEAPIDGITRGRRDADWVEVTGGGGGGTSDHRLLSNRNDPNQHSQSSITDLPTDLDAIRASIAAVPTPDVTLSQVITRDADTLNAANTYTDNAILLVPTPDITMTQATAMDAGVLADAKAFTTQQIALVPVPDVTLQQVNDKDATTLLSAKGYTDDQIANIGSIFVLRGRVDTFAQLPTVNKHGDVWLVGLEGTELSEYVWTLEGVWERFGISGVDLSNYYTKAETDAAIALAGDNTLTAANEFTTNQIALIPAPEMTKAEVVGWDAVVLASANANTTQQVEAEAAMRESADAGLMDLIDGLTLPTLTADLYLKSGGAMNQTKPTGAGTTLAGATMNTTEQLLYTFTYAAPEAFILYANNHYTLNFPWNTLATNRDYVFRYNYLVDGVQVLNETRPSFRPTGTSFTEQFDAINNLSLDVNVPAGTPITMRVYGRVLANTSAIGLLVNDVSNKARISRNEQSATVSATNVTTLARGTVESQENLNNYIYALLANVTLPMAPQASVSSATYLPAWGLYSTFPLTINANTTIDLTGLPVGRRTLTMLMGTTLRTVAFANAAGGLTMHGTPTFTVSKWTTVTLLNDGVTVKLYQGGQTN